MSTTQQNWKPDASLTAIDAAFPARVSHLMPAMADIPEEFKDWNRDNKWTQFQSDWFFKGLKELKIAAKDGINVSEAMRHLGCINGSFEPKHEHKKAAVAYLASLWFDDVTYTVAK